MPNIVYILSDGSETEVDANIGDSVMQTAVNNMIEGIVAECGGCLSCATCHVYVDESWKDKAGAPDENEKAILELALDPDHSSRLSCQITVTEELDGLRVRVPEAQF